MAQMRVMFRFTNSSGSWTQLGADIDGEAAGDKSGTSVSLAWDGTILAVGARLNGDNGQYAGHVRVYEWSGGSWTRLIRDLDGEAAGDQFGYAVALVVMGANRLVVGGINNDGTASNAGHARVYELAVAGCRRDRRRHSTPTARRGC